MLGSLELLRKRLPDDPRSIALLENAAQGAQRGTNLTKRMLAFARNYELNKEVIGIPDLVRGMTELLQRSLGPTFNLELISLSSSSQSRLTPINWSSHSSISP